MRRGGAFHASQTPPVIEREHLIDPDQGLFVVDDPVYPREHSTILAKRAVLQIQNSDLHNLPPRLDFEVKEVWGSRCYAEVGRVVHNVNILQIRGICKAYVDLIRKKRMSSACRLAHRPRQVK